MDYWSRMVQEAIGKKFALGCPDDEAQIALPLLWHWLTQTEASDEYLKDPAKLGIKAGPGGFLVSLSDETFGQSLDVMTGNLLGAFEAMEKALGKPNAPWRMWAGHTPKLRRKPKSP